MPVKVRKGWVSRGEEGLALSRQCALAGVARSTWYRPLTVVHASDEELTLLAAIDEAYTHYPFYGSRRMRVYLQGVGYTVNRKRIQRLMRTLGLAGMAPGPNTSRAQPKHPVYPYLLRGVAITEPNQVWSADITYLRLTQGFLYLMAIIDWYSRKVLAWQLSNTLEGAFCVEALEEALSVFGSPGMFNTDQGCQFTAESFTGVLKARGIAISMDGRGRALDNIFVERLWRSVKHEDVYLKGYANGHELYQGLHAYFRFYNTERPHQSLGYRTPQEVYRTGSHGGAIIVDKYKKDEKRSTGKEPKTEQLRSAA